jgi:hypothetical protein
VISIIDPTPAQGIVPRGRYEGFQLHLGVDVDSDLFVAGQATSADRQVSAGPLDDDPVAVSEEVGDTNCGSVKNRCDLAAIAAR